MNISVIGTGYVGLVTGACLSDIGMNVICADIDSKKIENLQNSIIPIYEPGLEGMVAKNIKNNTLCFTTDIWRAVEHADAIFISVGTPNLKDGSTDLRQVYEAATEIAGFMKSYKLIIIKSTVPIGTCRRVKNKMAEILTKTEIDFDIVSNPEFLREGCAVSDFFCPDRIVIGYESVRAFSMMKKIYEAEVFRNQRFIFTNIETAEMIKYASNAFLAAKIGFINEIAGICELCGADITVVARAMGMDSRIGDKFLSPSPGFGGSCFPKDVRALVELSKNLGYKPKIISKIMESNTDQMERSLKKIIKVVGDIKASTLTILGLAFKAETDDIRESPSVYLAEGLTALGASLKAFDPKAMDNMKKNYPGLDILYCENEYEACKNSDCIVIGTEWQQFRELDLDLIKNIMNTPAIVDLRNIYEPDFIKSKGFIYKGVGR